MPTQTVGETEAPPGVVEENEFADFQCAAPTTGAVVYKYFMYIYYFIIQIFVNICMFLFLTCIMLIFLFDVYVFMCFIFSLSLTFAEWSLFAMLVLYTIFKTCLNDILILDIRNNHFENNLSDDVSVIINYHGNVIINYFVCSLQVPFKVLRSTLPEILQRGKCENSLCSLCMYLQKNVLVNVNNKHIKEISALYFNCEKCMICLL